MEHKCLDTLTWLNWLSPDSPVGLRCPCSDGQTFSKTQLLGVITAKKKKHTSDHNQPHPLVWSKGAWNFHLERAVKHCFFSYFSYAFIPFLEYLFTLLTWQGQRQCQVGRWTCFVCRTVNGSLTSKVRGLAVSCGGFWVPQKFQKFLNIWNMGQKLWSNMHKTLFVEICCWNRIHFWCPFAGKDGVIIKPAQVQWQIITDSQLVGLEVDSRTEIQANL